MWMSGYECGWMGVGGYECGGMGVGGYECGCVDGFRDAFVGVGVNPCVCMHGDVDGCRVRARMCVFARVYAWACEWMTGA